MVETEILGSPPGAIKKSATQKRPGIEYATGLSLLGLTSGLVSVDSLIGGLKRDTVALLTGSDVRLRAAERYCIRAQLPQAKGGLDGGAFFIDGGNSFDVYMFTDLARRYHLDYDAALDRQSLSRAFTIYELRSLMEESERVFMARRPKLLVVSEVFSLFTEDIARYEARRVFRDLVSSISEISRDQRVPVLLTSASRHEALTPTLEERCNISADIVQGEGRVESRLFKHPWRAPRETVTETCLRNYNQDTLRTEAESRG